MASIKLLGRLGPSGSYAGKTDFQWTQRDVAKALRAGDCSRAKTLIAKLALGARTDKQRGAVFAMQSKALRCTVKQATLSGTRSRKTRDEYVVEQNWGNGHGWEEVVAEKTRTEIRQRYREYLENQPGVPTRWRKKRVKKKSLAGSPSEMDRFNDLNRQGFMRNISKKPKKPKVELPTVACNDCMNWHRKGQHTSSAAERKARRIARGTPSEQRIIP